MTASLPPNHMMQISLHTSPMLEYISIDIGDREAFDSLHHLIFVTKT